MEGTLTGSFNELTMQNGIPLTDEMQLQLSERYGGIDQWGAAIMDPALRGGLGVGGKHPIQVGKAGRIAPRRDAQPDGGSLARGSPTRWVSLPVHTCDRYGARRYSRSLASRHREPSMESSRSRCTERLRRALDRSRRARAPHPAVLRDDRQPRDVQGRLVAGDEDRAHPVGDHPRRAQAVRPGVWDPDAGPPSSTTCLTTSRKATTSPPSTPRRSRSSRICSGRRPSATRCCRCSRRCRRSSASCRRSRMRRRSSSAVTCRT